MKKLTIWILNKYSTPALKQLRKLGAVHVEHLYTPSAEGISALQHRIAELDKALDILKNLGLLQPAKKLDKEKITGCVKKIIALDEEKENLQKHLDDLERELFWFGEWGNVSLSSLLELEKAGVFIKLYVCSKSFLKNIPQDKLVQVLSRKGKNVRIALISRSKDEALNLPQVNVPSAKMQTLNKKIYAIKVHLQSIGEKLNSQVVYRKCFLECRADLIKRLEFFKVKFGMAQEEGVSYLQGYCPYEAVESIKKLAVTEGWGYLFEEPEKFQEVPTLIKNPAWVRIIKPVFKFMGTLPGYNEVDISFWFLLFFSLFFAMLIGDAGYGLLFLVITLLARRKFKRALPEPFVLGYVLSGATIAWGAVTGTWFGFEKIAQLPFFGAVVIDKINSYVENNQMFMMSLCFFIGVIHLTIAHGVMAVKVINSLLALAQLGWICIVWGVYFLARTLVLDVPLPEFSKYLLGAGIVLVALFSTPQRNIFKGMLVSLGDLPLKVISSFSDIISYIRLFAVGYASVMVSVTVNEMAIGAGVHSLIRGVLAAFILFFGHALNIVLGFMAVIVHGIRLNMLEFSGHLNMQWSGKAYRPFKE